MRTALESNHLSGDGGFTRRCHEALARLTGGGRVLLTTSCTHALEMSALLLDIQPGDEVIVPSFTFVSTANAFVLRGARPIFVDVRPDTFNIDESRIAEAITPRTRAIVLVHYAGVACAMDDIMALAARNGVAIVEDNAHGLFGAYHSRPLGSFGAVSTLSFHETKNITCGEGGALVVNQPSLFERAEILREKGTDRSRFYRGQVDRYTWVDVGSSYLPSDLLAAYLWAQIEHHQGIQQRRREIWRTYATELRAWAAAQGVQLPSVPDGCEHPAHLFYLVMPTAESRTALIRFTRERHVDLAFHYQALHVSAMGQRFGGYSGQCPVTEQAADRLVRLPMYYALTVADQAQVIEALSAFKCD